MFTCRQLEIIDSALEIISTESMEKLTMKNISNKLNISDAALYKHFKSKKEILLGIATCFEINSEKVLENILGNKLDNVGKVRSFFMNRIREFSANRGLAAVMFADDIVKQNPEFAAKLEKIMMSHRDLLIEAIKQGQIEKKIVPVEPEHLFIMVMGAMRLLITRWRMKNFQFDLLEKGRKLWQSIEKIITGQGGLS